MMWLKCLKTGKVTKTWETCNKDDASDAVNMPSNISSCCNLGVLLLKYWNIYKRCLWVELLPVAGKGSSPLWSRTEVKVIQVVQCLVKFWGVSRKEFLLPFWAASARASPPLGRQGLEPHHCNILVGSEREVMDQEQAETWGVNLCKSVFCSPLDWLHDQLVLMHWSL